MALTPASAHEVELLDEEYQHHVGRGSDLLAQGDLEGSVAALERARQLRPTEPRVLGLLGQALYRLGQLEGAAEAFQAVVDASPAEATPRVNLGLARLKAKRYAEAVRQFELALELQPGHQRALNYLGLAYLEQGDPARARECFVRTANDSMVRRCEEVLSRVPNAPDREVTAGAAVVPEPERLATVPSLDPDMDAAFVLARGFAVTRVAGDVLVRAERLVAVRGQVRLGSATEQQRGQPTERTFGEGARRMLRASGDGAIIHSMAGRRVWRLELDGTRAACLCDAVVFAFEGSLAYDNGRVASRLGADLDLVQLRGRGQVLLASGGELVLVPITPAAPMRLPVSALAGWIGALTPAFGALVDLDRGVGRSEAAPLAVELSGTGQVLLVGAAG